MKNRTPAFYQTNKCIVFAWPQKWVRWYQKKITPLMQNMQAEHDLLLQAFKDEVEYRKRII